MCIFAIQIPTSMKKKLFEALHFGTPLVGATDLQGFTI
jgi:hypothetical protein